MTDILFLPYNIVDIVMLILVALVTALVLMTEQYIQSIFLTPHYLQIGRSEKFT